MKKNITLLFTILITFVQTSYAQHSETSAFPTLEGMVMCGYQGWFACEGDGSGKGWQHYVNDGKFEPGYTNIEFWPDMRELDEDEKYATSYTHKDGSTAYVYSAYNRKTVLRHFRWMEEYNVDGIFLQRFVNEVSTRVNRRHRDTVTVHCLAGAEMYNRAFVIMYDMSGMALSGPNPGYQVIREDWAHLVDDYKVTSRGNNQKYLYHRGKPLVCLWGVGFNDEGRPDLDKMSSLIDFFHNDPDYGGCSVMLGVPYYWRELKNDATTDSKLLEVIKKADVIHPWAVGRFSNQSQAASLHKVQIERDIEWCDEHGLDYIPSIFPGFSWRNMHRDPTASRIPRSNGDFLWAQLNQVINNTNAKQLYMCMFDEMDEGTCFYKISNDPPTNIAPGVAFLTYENQEEDYYLYLLGQATIGFRESGTVPANRPERLTEEDLPVALSYEYVGGGKMKISYEGNLPAGTKLYAAYYLNKIPHGKPGKEVTRNKDLYSLEITTEGSVMTFDDKNGDYLSYVLVNEKDQTILYYTERIPDEIWTGISPIVNNLSIAYIQGTNEIHINSEEKVSVLGLYDSLGKNISYIYDRTNCIRISQVLQSGIYLLSLGIGQERVVKKLVIFK